MNMTDLKTQVETAIMARGGKQRGVEIHFQCAAHEDEQSSFVEYNISTGEVKTVTHIMQGETKIIPRQGEELKLGAIKLPSSVTEYGDTRSLLREVETHIFIYLDVSDAFRKFAAYYILLSYLYDKFTTLPYLRFIGDTGCDKSKALDVCGGLCYKRIVAVGH